MRFCDQSQCSDFKVTPKQSILRKRQRYFECKNAFFDQRKELESSHRLRSAYLTGITGHCWWRTFSKTHLTFTTCVLRTALGQDLPGRLQWRSNTSGRDHHQVFYCQNLGLSVDSACMRLGKKHRHFWLTSKNEDLFKWKAKNFWDIRKISLFSFAFIR